MVQSNDGLSDQEKKKRSDTEGNMEDRSSDLMEMEIDGSEVIFNRTDKTKLGQGHYCSVYKGIRNC